VTGPLPPPYGVASSPWGAAAIDRVHEPVDWPAEAVVAVLGTVYLAIAGAIAGLLWDAAAPKLSFRDLAASASATFHPQIGADAWFLLVTVLVGLVSSVALCLVVRRPGPGAAIALAVGGLLGAFVADRVGFMAERHQAIVGLRAVGFPATGDLVTQVDFRVRALGVVAGWPLVALVVLGIFVAIDVARRRQHPAA